MVQPVALIFGIVFLAIGVLGFFTSGTSMEADPMLAPQLFGLFPINALHNVVHLLFGVWGVVAARHWDSARTYCTVAGITYLALTLLGFIIPSTFGLMPIGGNDIPLHAFIGIVLTGVGVTAKPRPEAGTPPL